MTDQMALLAALQRDIAARLRPVCDGMSESQFEQLVRDIAAVKLKYGLESEVMASLRDHLTALVPPDAQGEQPTS